MAALAQSGVVDPYELERLAEELAEREGEQDVDTSYPLPLLEPLSHEHPLLRAENPAFDVEEFLISRSHTSLPDLRAELKDYLALLKDELVQLINDDYEAFISLSTDLRAEGARLERLQTPMSGLRSEIEQSRTGLLDAKAAVQAKLDDRTRLRREKALLTLLMKVSDSITRLESLLLIPPPADGTEPDGQENVRIHVTEDEYEERSRTGRAKHLARVAAEYVQLLYHADKAREENCAFVEGAQWRIDRIRDILSRDLDQVFGNALETLTSSTTEPSPQNRVLAQAELTECLKTYDLLGNRREAEEIVRVKVVQPFVKKSIFTGALTVPHTPILPRTPFPSRRMVADSVPGTPITPYTPFGERRTSLGGPIFYIANENNKLPLLDETDDNLATFYNNLLRFVEKDCRIIMDVTAKIGARHGKKHMPAPEVVEDNMLDGPDEGEHLAASSYFEIMANVIWVEIGQALMEELGAVIFSAGRPDEFKQHYTTTRAFIAALEYLAPDLRSVVAMRSHPTYAAFERRWQLPVYFQLRWKEIVGRLEDTLNAVPRISIDAGAQQGSPQAQGVVEAIRTCWRDDVYLDELGHRFWRLTLQIVCRYKNWLDDALPQREAPPQVAAAIREEKASLGAGRSGSATPGIPTQTEPAEATTTSDEARLTQLAILFTDIRIAVSRIMELWSSEISVLLPEPDEQESLKDVLQSTLSQLTSLEPYISNQIVLILTRRCCEPVAQVKQVTGQIRAMTRRSHSASSPSPFVSEILKPLRDFFGMGGVVSRNSLNRDTFGGIGRALREEFGAVWATEILQEVAIRYASYLDQIKKNEEALRRLKKNARTGFSLFGAAGQGAQDDQAKDDERVRAQMVMDVERLGHEAQVFEVALSGVPAYQALRGLAAQSDGT